MLPVNFLYNHRAEKTCRAEEVLISPSRNPRPHRGYRRIHPRLYRIRRLALSGKSPITHALGRRKVPRPGIPKRFRASDRGSTRTGLS